MSSAKRKLFANGLSNANVAESEGNGSTENMVYTVVSEGDSLPKELESPRGLHIVNEATFRATLNKDLSGKILIVGEGRELIQKQFASMKLPRSVEFLGSCSGDLLAVCTKEKFLLILLDMSSEATNALKLCSTIRYNTNSQNRTVAIIGVTQEGRAENYSSHGINDIVRLPLKEEAVHQLFLKWAGHTSCEGMPLTPESPEDEIALARKAAEIIKETEEQSFLGYHHHTPIISTVNCDYNHSTIVPEAQTKNSSAPQLTYYTQPPSGIAGQLQSTDLTSQRTMTNHQCPNNSGMLQSSHPEPLPPIRQAYRPPEHVIIQGPPFSGPHPIPAYGNQHRAHSTEVVQHHHSVAGQSGLYQANAHHYLGIGPTPSHYNPPFSYCPGNSYSNQTPVKPALVKAATHTTSTIYNSLSPLSHLGKPSTFGSPAYMVSGTPGTKGMKITLLHDDLSKHSSKERIRRERIKESCDQLRYLLPNISGKRTDMASILELTVKYVRFVNEMMPRPVMQEISQRMSACSTVHTRKRSQKDIHLKQGRPRLGPPPINQEPPTKLPPLLEEGGGPFRARAPTMVTTTGPVYLPHFHMGPNTHPGPGTLNPSNQLPGCYTHPCQTTATTSFAMPKDTSVIQQHFPHKHIGVEPVLQLHSHEKGNNPLSVLRHHQQMYFGNAPSISLAMLHTDDMPPQLNITKLPPISTISPCSSATDLSQCSMEQESTGSGQSSPDSVSMTQPLWETDSNMTGSREDLIHGPGTLVYK